MNNKQALLTLLTDRPVAYHPLFAKVCGGVTAGVLLSQLFYWFGKGKDAEGWIYKTQAEFTEETGLTRYEQEHARKQLRGLGVLQEKKKGIPAKLHFKIDLDALTSLLDSSIQGCGIPAYKEGVLQQTNTETTTETTTGDPKDSSSKDFESFVAPTPENPESQICECGHEKDQHYFGDNPGTQCMFGATKMGDAYFGREDWELERCPCNKYKPQTLNPAPRIDAEYVEFANNLDDQDVTKDIPPAPDHETTTGWHDLPRIDWSDLPHDEPAPDHETTTPKKKAKEPLTVSPSFEGKMVEKYPGLDVPAEIDAALNHKAVLKAIDVEQYVDTWLRKAQGYAKERSSPNGRATRPAIDANPETYSFWGANRE